jgi:hypothetical protein
MLNDNYFRDIEWPQSPLKAENLDAEQLKQFLRIRSEYEKSAFVSSGHLEVRALNPKEFMEPIPPGESAVTAVAAHPSGHVYGGTSGKNAHLFFYNPAPDADACVDIGVILPEARTVALCVLPNGMLAGAVNPCEPNALGVLFSYKSCAYLLDEKDFTGLGVREIFDLPAEDQFFTSTIDPCHSAGKIEILTSPIPEKISDLQAALDGSCLYLLGAASGQIFRCNIDGSAVECLGRLDPNGIFSEKLFLDHVGNLYGAGLYGRIFRWSPENRILEALPCVAPSLKGRELYNKITAWTCSSDGSIVGGTVDGLLFRFLPDQNKVICLGKPTAETFVSGLAWSGGKLYGIFGGDNDCAHLGCWNPLTGELKDLGCPLARSERPWHGYRFSCMTTGINGTIFMGESDRISHLFMYFPAVE